MESLKDFVLQKILANSGNKPKSFIDMLEETISPHSLTWEKETPDHIILVRSVDRQTLKFLGSVLSRKWPQVSWTSSRVCLQLTRGAHQPRQTLSSMAYHLRHTVKATSWGVWQTGLRKTRIKMDAAGDNNITEITEVSFFKDTAFH